MSAGAVTPLPTPYGPSPMPSPGPSPSPPWLPGRVPVPPSPGPRASVGGPGTPSTAPTCGKSPAFIGITGSDGAGSRSGAMVSGVASDCRAVTGIARASAPRVRTRDAGSADVLPPADRPLPSPTRSVKMNGPMADAVALGQRRDRRVDAGDAPDGQQDDDVDRDRGAERPAGAVPPLIERRPVDGRLAQVEQGVAGRRSNRASSHGLQTPARGARPLARRQRRLKATSIVT